MKKRKQFAWAVVYRGCYIDHAAIRYWRKDVIKDQIKEYREIIADWDHLSDAQFFRKLKRRHNFTVRRIEMKVVR